jgi:SOS regulatory protein LexA
MRTPSVKTEVAIKKIRQFHQKQRRVPTLEEMSKLFKFASKRSAFLLVERLVEAGLIEKDNKGRITIKRMFLPLPVLGSIRAGVPQDEEEQLIDTLSFDEYLVDRPESSYLLKVIGDSMEDAGLREGDIVIVDKRKEPKENDIVVANVDDQFTLKYFQTIDGKVCLVPGNKKYKIIYPNDSMSIQGVVISTVRRYR